MRLLALLLIAFSLTAEEAEVATARLKAKSVKEGQFVLGRHVTGAIPTECLTLRSKLPVCFFDLNGDGAITTDGQDGIGLADERLISPLSNPILLPEGQFTCVFSDELVEMVPMDTTLDAQRVAECSILTRLRIRAGLPLVSIDAEATEHCRQHLSYLKQNPEQAGMDLHNQYPGRPGYTVEGAAAGRGSCLYPGVQSLEAALLGWYVTAWHGYPLVDPSITRCGAACDGSAAIFYPQGRVPTQVPMVHPADGSSNIPIAFGIEIPNPVAGSNNGAGCGFPIYRGDMATGATVIVERSRNKRMNGQKISGHWSTPTNPANPGEWPTNSGLSLFIPESPLPPKSRILVTWTLADGSTEDIRFATE